ncbi:hypothetical protein G3N95_09750 [Paraburkholderia sp. Tr-20389]|uniref:hypothetical protein n=1 Tax=Paraburkholderia sp. Tr-20389 TaxID=2703903 RepID=UPI0019813837|nr:hypothetical protein [Paraburkholderia sp. Tr-20389]MBN3753228.1 hypothetical protein [Paraburkholderia sp. Tr-20389]
MLDTGSSIQLEARVFFRERVDYSKRLKERVAIESKKGCEQFAGPENFDSIKRLYS